MNPGSTPILVLCVGLIASGKSTVLEELMHLGAAIISTDILAKKIYAEKNRQRLLQVFGKDVLTKKGTINKEIVSALLFGRGIECYQEVNKRFLQEFKEDIRQEIRTEIDRATKRGVKYIIVESALGLVNKLHEWISFDLIFSFHAPERVRKKRHERRNPEIPFYQRNALFRAQPNDKEYLKISQEAGAVQIETEEATPKNIVLRILLLLEKKEKEKQ